MTVGTHYLRYDEHNGCLTCSFAPFCYLMCKQVETGSVDALGSANMLLDSLDFVTIKCFVRPACLRVSVAGDLKVR